MQFGAEPLFENISAKFGNGHRYGLIGANGCGKSTLMKIMSGELAPTSGNVSLTPGDKLGTLSQDQFAFEKYSVIDAVIMGDKALWEVKQERDRMYALPHMRKWTATAQKVVLETFYLKPVSPKNFTLV
jgi:ATPase subunit of ABC transporter with duplicated ATPase domains